MVQWWLTTVCMFRVWMWIEGSRQQKESHYFEFRWLYCQSHFLFIDQNHRSTTIFLKRKKKTNNYDAPIHICRHPFKVFKPITHRVNFDLVPVTTHIGCSRFFHHKRFCDINMCWHKALTQFQFRDHFLLANYILQQSTANNIPNETLPVSLPCHNFAKLCLKHPSE